MSKLKRYCRFRLVKGDRQGEQCNRPAQYLLHNRYYCLHHKYAIHRRDAKEARRLTDTVGTEEEHHG